MSMWREQVSAVTHAWLTPSCTLCHLPLEQQAQHGTCHSCQAWYAPIPRCQRCGLPCLTITPQCGQCLRSPPPWQRLFCIGDYHFPLSHAIHQLKYQRQFWQARHLAARLAECIAEPAPLITCVPLHWRRQLQRGFNQSECIARPLAKHLGRQFDPHLFTRKRSTPAQQQLTKSQREKNLAGAFQRQSIPLVNHVAIVDDVVTTGSTIRQLCDLLLEVGIERIDIYCLCRTPEPSDACPT